MGLVAPSTQSDKAISIPISYPDSSAWKMTFRLERGSSGDPYLLTDWGPIHVMDRYTIKGVDSYLFTDNGRPTHPCDEYGCRRKPAGSPVWQSQLDDTTLYSVLLFIM